MVRGREIPFACSIKDVIDRNLCTFGIAAFTRFDQRLAALCDVDQYYVLLLRRWVEEVASLAMWR